MWDKFTETAKHVVINAQEIALKHGEGYVSTEHLLLAILSIPNSTAVRIVQKHVSRTKLRNEILKLLPKGEFNPGKAPDPNNMTLTPRAKQVIERAWDATRDYGTLTLAPEHILYALTQEGAGVAERALSKHGLTPVVVRSHIEASGAKRVVPTLEAKVVRCWVAESVLAAVRGQRFTVYRFVIPDRNNLTIEAYDGKVRVFDAFDPAGHPDNEIVGEVEIAVDIINDAEALLRAEQAMRQYIPLFESLSYPFDTK